jgi:hypothetical protein
MMGALVVAVGVVIAGVLVYMFVFRWEPARKRWCVMFYLTSKTPASAAAAPVSQPNAETGVPAAAPAVATLDQKLDQVVNDVIRKLPCATDAGIAADSDWNDVYVAYRAVWDDASRKPEARVVRPEISAPTTEYFPGETVFDVGYAIDLTKDITLFFEWAYENCPADHYGVFFWGHAMGPAGFFQPNQKPRVVSPLVAFLMRVVFAVTGTRWTGNLGVRAISDAIGAIVQQRIRDGIRQTPTNSERTAGVGAPPPGAGAGGNSGEQIIFTVGQAVPKVDVVLFQDCWMGTLETAFELQDDVRYIVSSQSLVPSGFAAGQQLGAVWPYKGLIDTFLDQNQPNFAAPMMTVLNNFFEGVGRPAGTPPDYNRYPATKVLFSLIDCGATAGAVSSALKNECRTLVEALYPLGAAGRSALIELSFEKAGRLFELQGVNLVAGDQALVDILTFCAYLKTPAQWPAGLVVSAPVQNAITAAALALETKVTAVVTSTFQSPPLVPGDFVYKGVAALYKPFAIFGHDPYIMGAFRSSYETFRFSQETIVTPAPGGGAAECSWTQYAFDRHKWF